MSGGKTRQLRLAAEEAVVNIVSYSGATAITLEVAAEADRILLTLEDDGLPSDPTQPTSTDLSMPADQRPIGGLGIILMHQMTDSLNYQRTDGHNILQIEKRV